MSSSNQTPDENGGNLIHAEEETLVRQYLLGQADEAERQQIEERLLRDDAFVTRLLTIEDELIDDYARGALDETQRAWFERYFLTTPKRRQKLAIAQALVARANPEQARMPAATAEKKTPVIIPEPTPSRVGVIGWRAWLFPPWKIAAYAMVLLGLGLGVWRVFFNSSELQQGLLALNQAYRQQRPLEARISGFDYAPFIVTRGNDKTGDYRTLDEAEVLLRKAAREKGDAESRRALGRLYLAKKEFDKAIEQFEDALKLNAVDAQLQNDYGVALLEKAELLALSQKMDERQISLAKSLEHLTRAVEIDSASLEARFNRALVLQTLLLKEQARQEWEAYLQLDMRSAWAKEARSYLKLLEEERNKKAQTPQQRKESLYKQYLAAYQTKDQEAAWKALSLSYSRTGNYITETLADTYLDAVSNNRKEEAAIKLAELAFAAQLTTSRTQDQYFSDQVAAYRKLSPQGYKILLEARSLMKEVFGAYGQAKTDLMRGKCQTARELFIQAGANAEAVFADFWNGICAYPGLAEQSARTFLQLTQNSQARNYHWLQSIALNGLAIAYSPLGEYSLSIEAARHSQQQAQQLEDAPGALRSAILLAGLYQRVGNPTACLATVQQAITSPITADEPQTSGLFVSLAWAFSALHQSQAALACQQEVVYLARRANAPASLSRHLIHLGLFYGKVGKLEEAVKAITAGLDYGRQLGKTPNGIEVVSYAQFNLGQIHLLAGNYSEALTTFNNIAEINEANIPVLLRHWAGKGRLQTYIRQGNQALAQTELTQILQWLEDYRGKILEENYRNSFFEAEQTYYDLAIDLALMLNQDSHKAYDYAELGRARSLLDASQRGNKVIPTGTAAELKLIAATAPLKLEEIQSRLSDRVQILQYAVLENNLVLWVLTKQKLESRTIAVTAEQLSALVARYLEQLSRPATQTNWQGIAQELSEFLLTPVAPLLDETKLLCVIPDKALSGVPFATLPFSKTGKCLLESFVIEYAPSANLFVRASALAQQKARAGKERVLSVGNPSFDRHRYAEFPPLPAATLEAKTIAAFYPDARLLVEQEAQKSIVLRELNQADVIHIAAHHQRNPKYPMQSRILLAATTGKFAAEEDALSAYELYQHAPTRPRLVVLSACETRASTYVNGEGVIGFAQPFQAAGIPMVVTSLWAIDSTATMTLMTRFHQLRTQSKLATVAALRAAQLELFTNLDDRYRHPYYWASFVVVGGESIY